MTSQTLLMNGAGLQSESGPNSLIQRLVSLTAAGATVVVLVSFCRYALGAFFLFDDFAVVQLASNHRLGEFTSSPFIGFFRPAGFWSLRLLWIWFGWDHPTGYAISSLVLHILNAGLVFTLARVLGYGRGGAGVAAVAFFSYGPAAETVFWTSAIFDRLATCGLLIALVSTAVASRRSGRLDVAIGLLFTLSGLGLSVLAKETGFVVPAVLLTVMLAVGRSSPRKIALFVVPCVVTAGLLLLWRSEKMPILDGAYGNWLQLTSQASVVHNFGVAFLAGLHPPLPFHEARLYAGRSVDLLGVLAIGSWGLVWVTGAANNWRLFVALSVSWALLFLPAAWATLIPGSSAAGRFLYAPGVCSALVLAHALRPSPSEGARQRLAAVTGQLAGAIVMALSAVSLAYQSSIWRSASQISQSTIEQLGGFRDYTGTVYVSNLPFWYEQGPYVVKDYAFRAYYGAEYRAVVRGRAMTLTYDAGQSRFAGWVAAETAPTAAPTETDRVITLQLPLRAIQAQPAGTIVEVKAGRGGATVLVSGWALDGAARRGCGVDFVHLYVRTAGANGDAGRQQFVASARVQDETPALAAWPPQFRACGWTVTTSLPVGQYEFIAYPHDLVVGDFAKAATASANISTGALND
jgi:hypothetical protein